MQSRDRNKRLIKQSFCDEIIVHEGPWQSPKQQLDLTVAVRMDWHEGFQLYGERGSVVARTYNPWYYPETALRRAAASFAA